MFHFLAFQTSTCFQYGVNSESEDSEQETENESSICPKVTYYYLLLKYVYL